MEYQFVSLMMNWFPNATESPLPKGTSIVSPYLRIFKKDSLILLHGQSRLPPWNPQVAIHCSTSRTTQSYSVSSFSHDAIRGIDVDEDITFCGAYIIPSSKTHLNLCLLGDWAGNSYNSSGCPGTCAEVLLDPTNFVVWSFSLYDCRAQQAA